MISLKNYQKSLFALLLCCTFVPAVISNEQNNLVEACILGNFQQAQHAINKGADVNAQDEYTWTPLHHACNNGNLNIAQLLIEKGANVDAQDAKGKRPLHLVCDDIQYAQPAPLLLIVQLLIENGADVNAQDGKDLRPLQYALLIAGMGGNTEIIYLLRKHGATIPNNIHYGSSRYTANNFNTTTTQARPALLQHFIACNIHPNYVLQKFVIQPKDIQQMLMQHALLHNLPMCNFFYSLTNNNFTLPKNNSYIAARYKQLTIIPQPKQAQWYTSTAAKFANIIITTNN